MKKITKINKYILLYIASLIFVGSLYVIMNYKISSFDQLLYTVSNMEGTGVASIISGILIVILASLIMFFILLLPILLNWLKYKINIVVTLKKREHVFVLRGIEKHRLIYSIVVLMCSIILSLTILGFFKYLIMQNQYSTFIEENYVDPNDVEIKFPNKKRNLIYIYLESMEMTNASKENGGDQKDSYIPNLEKIALNNINFSNDDDLGGAHNLSNTSWTIAAMLGQTAGVPLKLDIDANNYESFSSFMSGVTSLGEILEKEEYKNYLMIGSDAKFGGRKDYFTQHGNYEIFDYKTAKKEKKIKKNYSVWWGFEDKKLFTFAKEKLNDLAKNDEPFNFTLLTADTHFIDGYLDDSCSEIFKKHYANSIYCSDGMVNEFIKWISKQDFYENTTIIIIGDHLTMQNNFYKNDNYDRVIYNAIINSAVEPNNQYNRMFTSLDMFPTTLAAMGVSIEGDRLGLGTNLFSNKKTLAEKYGLTEFNDEISKRSHFYNDTLVGDSYYEMEKSSKKREKKGYG